MAAISEGETVKLTTYSAAVQKVVVMVNAGILGLVQLMNQQSFVLESHKAAFLCFYVFTLSYSVLRILEAIDVRLRPGIVTRLVGHTSHLFGGLAALVLFSQSQVSTTFALILLLLWLSAVVYNLFNKFMNYSEASKSGAGLPQSSPV